MSKVKGRGNRSTEEVVARFLTDNGIEGWVRNCKDLIGSPDFFFKDLKLAVFVDGCFWHGCAKCDRSLPRTRTEFWESKIDGNRRRDQRTTRELRRSGIHVMRIWEHTIRDGSWVSSLRRMLTRLG
jgi:DNA mismatch endonuclease, patch repair protein